MAALSNDAAITFYGTLGKGLDDLARTYLTRTLLPSLTTEMTNYDGIVIDYTEGKMIFQVPQSVLDKFQKVLKRGLKFFERLFILIDRKSLVQDGIAANKRTLFDYLYSTLLDSNLTTQKSDIWQDLQAGSTSAGPSGSAASEVTFRLSIKCTGKWRRKIDVAVRWP